MTTDPKEPKPETGAETVSAWAVFSRSSLVAVSLNRDAARDYANELNSGSSFGTADYRKVTLLSAPLPVESPSPSSQGTTGEKASEPDQFRDATKMVATNKGAQDDAQLTSPSEPVREWNIGDEALWGRGGLRVRLERRAKPRATWIVTHGLKADDDYARFIVCESELRPIPESEPEPVAPEPTRELGASCEDCGRQYGNEYGFPDFIIPFSAWRQISTGGDDSGLLCPSCICKRLHAAGLRCEGAFTSGPIVSVSEPTISALRRVENIELAIAGRDNRWAAVREILVPQPSATPYESAVAPSADSGLSAERALELANAIRDAEYGISEANCTQLSFEQGELAESFLRAYAEQAAQIAAMTEARDLYFDELGINFDRDGGYDTALQRRRSALQQFDDIIKEQSAQIEKRDERITQLMDEVTAILARENEGRRERDATIAEQRATIERQAVTNGQLAAECERLEREAENRPVWRCYHCAASFTKREFMAAREHFGLTDQAIPQCVADLRADNERLTREREEANTLLDRAVTVIKQSCAAPGAISRETLISAIAGAMSWAGAGRVAVEYIKIQREMEDQLTAAEFRIKELEDVNHSVAVCASHTERITDGDGLPNGCLVCAIEDGETLIEAAESRNAALLSTIRWTVERCEEWINRCTAADNPNDWQEALSAAANELLPRLRAVLEGLPA